ncbi:MAG: hypothetical protein NC916_01510 [Candidatus Omnitrophica bacterium]|nr:hypothetical protein [Candidatus Omnitrophota bacterium]
MNKRIITICAAAVFVCGLIGIAASEEITQKPIELTTTKNLRGEVAGISPTFLALVYDADKDTAYEMALSIDKEVKIKGIGSLKEIGIGDIVSVLYEEVTTKQKIKDKDGKEKDQTRIKSRLVKEITFLKAAPKIEMPKAMEQQEEPAEEAGQEGE